MHPILYHRHNYGTLGLSHHGIIYTFDNAGEFGWSNVIVWLKNEKLKRITRSTNRMYVIFYQIIPLNLEKYISLNNKWIDK